MSFCLLCRVAHRRPPGRLACALHPGPPCPDLCCPPRAAAWRIDDYLGGEEGEGEGDDDDLDLASLRAHRLQFVKDRKDAMSRKCVGAGLVGWWAGFGAGKAVWF